MLPKIFPGCTILSNWVFNNIILDEGLFERSFETSISVNNNLCGKLFPLLESPQIFDGIFKVTSLLLFIPDFNLLSCKLENFTFKVLYWEILYWYYVRTI